MADDSTIDLMGGGFTRGMLAELEQKMVLEAFGRHVQAVVHRINDGKEATVYLCRSASGGAGGFLAAKVYRDRRFRAFANNSSYTDPARVRDRRMAKAIRKRTRVGRQASQRLWVDREWEALSTLFDAGASVPEPYDHAPDAVLMEFIGDANGPAPMLAHVRLAAAEAERAYACVLRDVAVLLECGLVHGDLSAYNILYHGERPRLIDLPQAVGLDDAVDAWSIFYRDLENIGAYFGRQGVAVDTMTDAMRLWQQHAM